MLGVTEHGVVIIHWMAANYFGTGEPARWFPSNKPSHWMPLPKMRDPTAQTKPLTLGQQIVAAHEADMIAEPCELAQRIDDAIASERERCAKLLESHESPYDNSARYYARIIRKNERPV